jgi:hypothetical protein
MAKRITEYIFLSVLLTTITHAQLLKGYGLKLGTVAANQTWQYTGIPDLPRDTRWGFTAIAFVELLDLANFSALIEVQYTQKGFIESIPITTESQPDGTGEFVTKRPRVDYLSIPLLAKVRLPISDIALYAVAGPRYDMLLGKKSDGYDAVIDKFKTSEFGATFGVGVELTSILPRSVLAEFRYNPSFTGAFNNNYLTVRNRSFDFLLGARL